jgi:hypothetical protein
VNDSDSEISESEEEEEDNNLAENAAQLNIAEKSQQPIDVPPIKPVDQEVKEEIWNKPRKNSSNIELDSNKTETILNIMSNFKLPTPSWAQEVPEEIWKEDLLSRIRQRQDQIDEKDGGSASHSKLDDNK